MSRQIFIATLICAAPAYAETTYFAAIPDLPVASGLTESASQPASFAADENSALVIVTAHGSVAPENVRAFYMNSLSALGWAYEPVEGDGELTFLRGRERLVLRVEPHEGGSHLGVRLVVSAASMNAD